MQVFFSIIIPTYNRVHFLKSSLNSVIEQSYDNWECIVVDDGSTDSTEQFVLSLNEPRIRYFYKKNEERSIARNYGIRKSKGSYICFLDSDDIYYNNHLSVLNNFIIKNKHPVGLICTGIDEKVKGIVRSRPLYNSENFTHPIFFIWQKFILINSVCVHKNILEDNKFPKQFNIWEDTHLWLRIVSKYPFYQIKTNTTIWNNHENNSVSRNFKNLEFNNIRNYVLCIEDLFSRYGSILQPYLNSSDKKNYQFSKIKMFARLAIQKNRWILLLKIYFLAIFKLRILKMNRFIASLFKAKFLRKGVQY